MNTVLEIALSTRYSAMQIPALVEIIYATGNPEVASELILGIYKEPTISEHSVINNNFCTFDSYNKFTDEVTYTYTKPKVKEVYVSKDVNPEDVTLENFKDHTVQSNGKWINIPVPGETQSHKDFTRLPAWENGVSKLQLSA